MMSESSIRDELIQSNTGKLTKRSGDKDVMGLIDSIGELDFTGEKDRKKKEREMEKFRQKLIAQGVKSKEELRMLERKKVLTTHVYRRPSYLKKTIDGNTKQLQYIYNRRLRRGVQLSGKMLVEININPSGRIDRTSVINSNMGDTEFEKMILSKIKTWKFHSVPDSLGSLKIRYPFEFYEEL
jgi:TonB family protein